MTTFVSKDVQDGLDAARIAGKKARSRLRVRAGDTVTPVLGMWPTGFSVEVGAAPAMRGRVDLFDGTRHLAQCLIVASEEVAGEMRYEFKRSTEPADRAALDFYSDPTAPVALIEARNRL